MEKEIIHPPEGIEKLLSPEDIEELKYKKYDSTITREGLQTAICIEKTTDYIEYIFEYIENEKNVENFLHLSLMIAALQKAISEEQLKVCMNEKNTKQ